MTNRKMAVAFRNSHFQSVKDPPILPPAFMRGVPEGRGEFAYLRSKYAQMPATCLGGGHLNMSKNPSLPFEGRWPGIAGSEGWELKVSDFLLYSENSNFLTAHPSVAYGDSSPQGEP